jgi:hypothetical protein
MAHFSEWENPRDSHRYLSTNQLFTPIAILASLVAPTEAQVCVTEEFQWPLRSGKGTSLLD